MKRFCVMILCLSILFFWPLIKVSAVGTQSDETTSDTLPTPQISDLLKDTLETLTISEGIQHIGYAAFNECKKLTTVKLPPNLISIANSAL